MSGSGNIVTAPAAESFRPKIAVVTVTHNSAPFFCEYLNALQAQTLAPHIIVLVDSGSTDSGYLYALQSYTLSVELIRETNIGFCAGNNMGWRKVKDFDYVLFLNPDAFLAPNFLEVAIAYMKQHPEVGLITGSLLRYDIDKHLALDIVDTTGVVRNCYGIFADRDSSLSASVLSKYDAPNEIPWLCAAAVLGRRDALITVTESDEQIFDESLFMYKDDVDLSWRVRRAGWKIIHHPGLIGYHCRGWKSRKSSSRWARLISARNEFRVSIKNRSPFAVLSALKYALVFVFDI